MIKNILKAFFCSLLFFALTSRIKADSGYILVADQSNIAVGANQQDYSFAFNVLLKLKATGELVKAQQDVSYRWVVDDANIVTGRVSELTNGDCPHDVEKPCPNMNVSIRGLQPGVTTITVTAMKSGQAVASTSIPIRVEGQPSAVSTTVAPSELCDSGLKAYTWDHPCQVGVGQGYDVTCNNGYKKRIDFTSCEGGVDEGTNLERMAIEMCKKEACPQTETAVAVKKKVVLSNPKSQQIVSPVPAVSPINDLGNLETSPVTSSATSASFIIDVPENFAPEQHSLWQRIVGGVKSFFEKITSIFHT